MICTLYPGIFKPRRWALYTRDHARYAAMKARAREIVEEFATTGRVPTFKELAKELGCSLSYAGKLRDAAMGPRPARDVGHAYKPVEDLELRIAAVREAKFEKWSRAGVTSLSRKELRRILP